MSESVSNSVLDKPREQQVKEHYIALDIVEAELPDPPECKPINVMEALQRSIATGSKSAPAIAEVAVAMASTTSPATARNSATHLTPTHTTIATSSRSTELLASETQLALSNEAKPVYRMGVPGDIRKLVDPALLERVKSKEQVSKEGRREGVVTVTCTVYLRTLACMCNKLIYMIINITDIATLCIGRNHWK